MEAKILNGKCKFEVDESFDNERFMKVSIMVMHSGANYNGSTFSLSAIENAKDSLANIPILANVVEDEDGNLDFGAHDMTLEENKLGDGYKFIYLEKVVGVIPETNNHELVEKEGKTYVKCEGFIHRGYSNYVEDLLEKQDSYSVSMEILVDDYEINSKNLFDIKSYRYCGITLLGTEILPGMKGANLEVQKFDLDKTNETVSQYAQELKLIFEAQNKQEEFIEEETTEEDPETTEPEEDMGCGDKDKYELTMNDKLRKLQEGIEDEVERDEDGVFISGKYFWVMDATETVCYISMEVYKADGTSDRTTVRAKYDTETFVIDKSTFEEVFCQYLTQAEIDMVEASRVQADFAYAEAQKQIETLTNENTVLSEFKKTIETEQFKAEVDDKLAEFEDEIGNADEFKSLKETAYSMTLDAVEKECFAIVGRSKHTPKAPTAKKAKPVSFVGVDNKQSKGSGKYGEFEKYFDK